MGILLSKDESQISVLKISPFFILKENMWGEEGALL